MSQSALDLPQHLDAHSTIYSQRPSSKELLSRYLGRHLGPSSMSEAERLLLAYGDIGGISQAAAELPPTILGVSESVAADLALLRPLAEEFCRDALLKRDLLTSFSAVLSFLKSSMQHDAVERVRILFLDSKNRLITDEVHTSGTVNHTSVYPREVARRALIHNATAVILAHNHPSGDPQPSQNDISMTRTLVEALRPLDIVVHDHLVIGRNGHASFRSLGLI